jgi:hypothetical protein
MVMKRGRPAKAGERYPSGDLKRRPNEQQHAVLPRVRELFRVAQGYNAVKALALDPRMSPDYAPGQLFLLGLVSAGELEDGARIARTYGRFERLHARRRSSSSPDYRLGRGGGEGPDDDAEAIENDFALLHDALMVHGASALAAVEQFWVEGRHIDSRALRDVLRITAAARRQCDKVRKRRKLGVSTRLARAAPSFEARLRRAPQDDARMYRIRHREERAKRASNDHPTPPAFASLRSAPAGDPRSSRGQAPPPPGEGVAAPPSRRAPYGKQAWVMLARAINPTIAAERIDAAWDALTALKERERFRRDKDRGRL